MGLLAAKGSHPTFAEFVLITFGIFVPMNCPGVEYVHYLVMVLKAHVQEEVAEIAKVQRYQRECRVLKDAQVGGPNAYKSVRDPDASPFSAIESEISVPVVLQRWKERSA